MVALSGKKERHVSSVSWHSLQGRKEVTLARLVLKCVDSNREPVPDVLL